VKRFIERFSNLSFSDTMLKVLSVFLAIICWYGIQAVTNSSNTAYQTEADGTGADKKVGSVVLPIRVVAPTRKSAFRIDLQPEQARVKMDFSALRNGANESGAASIFVDCSDINSDGEYRLPISCIASGGTRVVDIEPSSAIVSVVFIE